AREVALRIEAIAAGGAPRREQFLILQVADLRDRDVGKLLRERLGHGTDRQRLLSRGGLVGSARACSPAARAPLALALRPALRALRSGLWRAGCHQRTRKVSLSLPICTSSP